MFLLAVKIMPGAEKVQGEVLRSEETQFFFLHSKEVKTVFSEGSKLSSNF